MLHDEARVGRAAQEPVELRQLAALALATHPALLERIPLTRAMEEEEPIRAVARVEIVHAPPRGLHQLVIARPRALVRIGEVGQQREMEMRIAIAEETHLQLVEEAVQPILGVHDHRNDDHRPVARGNAVAQVELRQRPRVDLRGHEDVEQADGQLAERQHRHQRDDPELDARTAVPVRVRDEARDGDRRERRDGAEIPEHGVPVHEARQALAPLRRIAERALEAEAAARDQVVADVMRPVVRRRGNRRLARHLHRAARDLLLLHARALGELFDGVAIAIACLKIHPGVGASRVLAEDLLDQADPLEEQRPVDRRQQPHARDDVADGELIRRLALVLQAEHLFRRVVLRFERVLQRDPRGGRRRRLIAKPVEELDDEGSRQRTLRFRLLVEHPLDDRFRVAPARAEEQPPLPRAIARAPRGHHVPCEALQVLDEREAQHDRDRPDLADRQRRDALIRGGEIDEDLQIESSGGVRRDLPGDDVHARIAGERTVGELRQLEVVPAAADPVGSRGSDPGRRGDCRAASLQSRPAAARRTWPRSGIDRPCRDRARFDRAGAAADARGKVRAPSATGPRRVPHAARAGPGRRVQAGRGGETRALGRRNRSASKTSALIIRSCSSRIGSKKAHITDLWGFERYCSRLSCAATAAEPKHGNNGRSRQVQLRYGRCRSHAA